VSNISFVAGVIVGCMFVWAGAAKLSQGKAWQVAGTPFSTGNGSLDAGVRKGLPLLEIVLGAFLAARVLPVVMGTVACVLLGVFTLRIVQLLSQGKHPRCSCFGATSQAPLSQKHVWRNAALLALSVLVIAGA
jgi:hypothetical protein